ncbi:MAG: hypothetical protein KIT16_00860 [Rhodospirillaceae bacterium]|nr:hypothetical protein [Rhodospirillaceae bacterium]
MKTGLVCASHSPLMYCYHKAPDAHQAIEGIFKTRANAVAALDPEIVFVFGPDHYTSFFRRLAPSHCIGIHATAAGDIGGHAGALDVPADLALACAGAIRDAGIDIAVSYDLMLDHGISQTLHRIVGGVAARPTIPIAFNIMTPPLPAFRRSRLLGEAVGKFAASRGLRALFIGSGGLSHNPLPIFPPYGTGPDEVNRYEAGGPGAGPITFDSWLDRMTTVHKDAAVALSNGGITADDCKFNARVDEEFLDLVTSGKIEAADDWSNEELVKIAGIGSVEIHTWIAACAANAAAGGAVPIKDIYAQVVEYGVAVGIVHA